ncbi:MAG TPA: LeuA family protein [Myxococcota bacterium]|nr:LeuA family protein [Myxococcota bacterium]
MQSKELIYDWNIIHKIPRFKKTVEICDETLRDGIQSPSAKDPNIDEKCELLALMAELSITIADIGLPGAGPRAYNDVLALASFAQKNKLAIKLNCAARTLKADIEPIAKIQEIVGIPITAYCFLGASPIRQIVEDWNLDKLKKTSEDAIVFAKKEQLSVAFVTEDTTRSSPETLSTLFNHAIELGAERLVLCDTVGHATPFGVKALIDFARDLIKRQKAQVYLDWHGHNDRGLAVANAIFAAEYGCDRVHGTALGIGERVGNTAIDQLLVNLKLLNAYPHKLDALPHYLKKAAQAAQLSIPYNYPVFGEDAFKTATGVHAAAVIKALKTGDRMLADLVYSGVPANWFGKSQVIEIGPMSGASNVRHWLQNNGKKADEHVVSALLEFAKKQDRTLTLADIEQFLAEALNKA